MNDLPPSWRNISVTVGLCVALLAACDVLGYKSPAQSTAARNTHERVVNSASKNPLMGKTYNRTDAVAVANDGATQAGVEAKTVADKGAGDDCTKYLSGQTYYLQSSDGKEKVARVKVGATGYGAPPKNYYPEGQRRLMTIRASKIDAYRALAEVVGGLHIWGGSAIGDMVIERDRYHTFIDTYVRGARVITVAPMQDGTYKTEVEMDVDQAFLSRVMAFADPAVVSRCHDQWQRHNKGSYAYYGANGVAPNFYYSEQ